MWIEKANKPDHSKLFVSKCDRMGWMGLFCSFFVCVECGICNCSDAIRMEREEAQNGTAHFYIEK